MAVLQTRTQLSTRLNEISNFINPESFTLVAHDLPIRRDVLDSLAFSRIVSALPTDAKPGDFAHYSGKLWLRLDSTWAQVSHSTSFGSTLPTTPAVGDTFILSSGLRGFYYCATAGTWNFIPSTVMHVEANPDATPTANLTSIQIGDTVYAIPQELDISALTREVPVLGDEIVFSDVSEVVSPSKLKRATLTVVRTLLQANLAAVAKSGDYADLTNKPSIPDRAGAFTPADEAKLDGIEVEAQRNPRHVGLAFRTQNAATINPGEIVFYKADNTEWQSGSSDQIVAIELDREQCTLQQNPGVDDATYTGWHSLPNDIVENGGSVIWTFQRIADSSPFAPIAGTLRIQAETTVKNDDGNFVLQNVTILEGLNNNFGTGVNWQVVGAFAPPSGADAVIGVLDKSKLPSDTVYAGTQRFTTGDEASLDKLVNEHDIPLGSYVRESSNSSLAAGQFYLSGNSLELVPAGGYEAAVASVSTVGTVLRIGDALFTITSASTLGATRRTYTGTLSGSVADSGTFSFARRGEYALQSDIPEPLDLSPYAKIADLSGKEEDAYFSYTNAVNDYWVGTMKWYNQSTGVPDSDNLVRQPDIANGTYTIAVGTPRTDRDPSNFALGTPYNASDFSSGQVYYLSDWDYAGTSATLTLTSGGTVTGTGNARRVYFTAQVVLSGTDLPDVRDDGNYWRFSLEEPTQYKIKIPSTDVLNPPWLLSEPGTLNGSILPGSYVLVKTTSGWGVATVSHFGEHVRPVTSQQRKMTLTYKATQDDVTATENSWTIYSPLNAGSIGIRVHLAENVPLSDGTTLPRADVVAYYSMHHNVDIVLGSKEISGNPLSYSIAPNQTGIYLLTMSNAEQSGAFVADEAAVWTLQSNIVGRDEFGDVAFDKRMPDTPAAQSETKFYRLEVPSTANSDTSGVWNEHNDTSPFDVHDDVTTKVTTLGDDYRFVVSAEDQDGDPNQYVEADDVAAYILDGVGKLIGQRQNFGATWATIIDAATYASLENSAKLDAVLYLTSDNWKTYVGTFRKAHLSTTSRWFIGPDNYANGNRIEFRLSGSGNQTVVQCQANGAQSFRDANKLVVVSLLN